MDSQICAFADCGRKMYARTWCSSHYEQWRKGIPQKPVRKVAPRNDAYEGIKRDDPNKFWLLTEEHAGCLVWLGKKYPNGYGVFIQNKTAHLAHRYAYSQSVGSIPNGVQIDHVCHNRACVEPSHLRLASVKQNQENLSGLRNGNTSGYRGVSKCRNRWRAFLTHNGKFMHLGTFDTPEEANEAVVAKRNELYTHNDLDRVA